jgi:hypothetical protein
MCYQVPHITRGDIESCVFRSMAMAVEMDNQPSTTGPAAALAVRTSSLWWVAAAPCRWQQGHTAPPFSTQSAACERIAAILDKERQTVRGPVLWGFLSTCLSGSAWLAATLVDDTHRLIDSPKQTAPLPCACQELQQHNRPPSWDGAGY